MPTFTPPEVDGNLVGDPRIKSWGLYRFHDTWTQGATVWNNRTLVTPSVQTLRLPGTGYASTPDASPLDITGDIDIRVYCSLDDWTPAAASVLASKHGGASDVSWQLFIQTSGIPRFDWSTDGTSSSLQAATSAPGFADGSSHWLRVTMDVNNGASQRVVTFYTSTDGSDWTQLSTHTGAVTSIFPGTQPLMVGARRASSPQMFATGRFHYVEVRDGIDGTVVASPDFRTVPAGATSFLDSQASPWSVTAPASVVENVPAVYELEWHQSDEPYLGGAVHTTHDTEHGTTNITTPDEGLATAARVYDGGHVHDVSLVEAFELAAAGYGDRLDIADREVKWNPGDQLKLTRHVLSVDPPNASDAPVVENSMIVFRNRNATAAGTTNLREGWVLDGTAGWEDVEVVCEGIDPPFFAIDGPTAILPQMGTILRFFDTGSGYRMIALQNNTFLGVPVLNVGVWTTNYAGTAFNNRQYSWQLLESLPLPYGWKARLVGNTITVTIFPAGQAAGAPYSNDPSKTKVINLDTDAGDAGLIPTPPSGQCGFVSNHLGSDPRSACRVRATTFRRIT